MLASDRMFSRVQRRIADIVESSPPVRGSVLLHGNCGKRMNDKRQTERQGVAGFDVQCRTLLGDGRTILGTVVDSSEGGARVRGPSEGIGVGEHVQVVFLYPSGEQVAHHATVCHTAPEGNEFGVRFDSDPIPIVVHS